MREFTVILLVVAAAFLPFVYYGFIPTMRIRAIPKRFRKEHLDIEFTEELKLEAGDEDEENKSSRCVWSGCVHQGDKEIHFQMKTAKVLQNFHFFWAVHDQFRFMCKTLIDLVQKEPALADVNLNYEEETDQVVFRTRSGDRT